MGRLILLAGAMALALGGGLFFIKDGGVRGKVAVETAVEKIDRLLGPMKLDREKIASEIENVKSQMKEMRKEKISLNVRAESLASKIGDMEKSLGEMDQKLAKLRDVLERFASMSESVVIAGKEYTKSSIEAITTDLIEKREGHKQAIDSLRQAGDILREAADDLAEKVEVAESKIARLGSKLTTVDAKIAALETMKVTNPNPVGEDESFAESLNKLEVDIDRLSANVEAELRIEQDEWNKAATERATHVADTLLRDLEDPVDMAQKTIQKIDAILGDRENSSE